jgi:hypothetical protein
MMHQKAFPDGEMNVQVFDPQQCKIVFRIDDRLPF